MSALFNLISVGIVDLEQEDCELFDLLELEAVRQEETLSLVASSGGTAASVLAALATASINVTAEGYPGSRYHGGCELIDKIEELAIARAKSAFKAQYANVQPHAASTANQIVLHALLRPGDPILAMNLESGGHLSHGASFNISGQLFDVATYGVDEDGRIDYDALRELAHAHRPKLLICGATAYARTIDFGRFREIADEVGAWLLADITHVAGLVAAGIHPSPIDHAHVTTMCTFKQLFGPRGGLILMGRDSDAQCPARNVPVTRLLQQSTFPLIQGSPNTNTIAAKAAALRRLVQPEFGALMHAVRSNAEELAANLASSGFYVVTGGTDTHIVLVEAPGHLSGKAVQDALGRCGIVVNKNKVPGDTRSAQLTSGFRLGTNTVTLRGMKGPEMATIAHLISLVIDAIDPGIDEAGCIPARLAEDVRRQVRELTARHPLPYDLTKGRPSPVAHHGSVAA